MGGDRYRLGSEAVGFDQYGSSVRVAFADGSSTGCDLLVGADGVGSTIRRLLLPEVEPRYAGYVAWRGTVSEDLLSPATFQALDGAITYQKFPDSHILVYPIPSKEGSVERGRRLMNFVWYRNVGPGQELRELLTGRDGEVRTSSLPPGAAREQYLEEIRRFAAAHMAPPVADVVLGTEQPFVQVIFDLEVRTMAFARVCLIGDAAFAARPHAAAGTAKAAANAWALAEAVAAAGNDVVAALRHRSLSWAGTWSGGRARSGIAPSPEAPGFRGIRP
jgi:2,6-dihydroxypyridine 3-monooxygenase